MAVSDDRQYTSQFVHDLLEGVKGKTLGEVDITNQFARTLMSPKVTGIAGNVIEQSVFRYQADSQQECDIQIDGQLVELKTTGVRIPKSELKKVEGKTGKEYNQHLHAKEGISVTGVTFSPDIERDFELSHFWDKAQRMLIVFYEYKSYTPVLAHDFAFFPIVDYCYNTFSESEKNQLKSDWMIVRNFLSDIYSKYASYEDRVENLEGFTHQLRPHLLLIELVPGFHKREADGRIYGHSHPRYRLKQTFVNYIVQGHFNAQRQEQEVSLGQSFSSFAELDQRCHNFSQQYAGKTFAELKTLLNVETAFESKDFAAQCVLKMFDANGKRLNQISDFIKAGIVAKTITLTSDFKRTEDMKLQRVDFEEWSNADTPFEESAIYTYFSEHCFLFPIFQEQTPGVPQDIKFLGFKRFFFSDDFIQNQVHTTWQDTKSLILNNQLAWEYRYDKQGNRMKNKTGSYIGAPNLPKSSKYEVFFRGGANDSRDEARTDIVNGIRMLPQFFWIKGSLIANKLNEIDYL